MTVGAQPESTKTHKFTIAQLGILNDVEVTSTCLFFGKTNLFKLENLTFLFQEESFIKKKSLLFIFVISERLLKSTHQTTFSEIL